MLLQLQGRTVELRIEGREVLPMGLSNLLPGGGVLFLG